MADIVLTTLNAKYLHAAFGLRYLYANLSELQLRACIAEFDINQRPLDIAEAILQRQPTIVGLGVYIWNTAQTAQVITALKRVRPELVIILGGPEVSYETIGQRVVELADYVVTGEADLAFAALCRQLLSGTRPEEKIIAAPLPEFHQLQLPYEYYSEQDLQHRVVYLEASRGCPFTCEFCLSSLDIPVRQAPLDHFLQHLQRLIDRGLKQFKFVDRTFNLNLNVSRAILQFLLDRHQPGRFYHFEMIPDRLPEGLRELIARFPAGTIQFEVGIQTFNPDASALISRRQNLVALSENFRFLREHTGVHVHADLIVGLPGEDLQSFGEGFDRLLALRPQEIQVGILKRLRGTPIVRHDAEWDMRYNADPPYEILQTRLIPFADMQRMRRFARYWDLVGNSGNFTETLPLIWSGADSPFQSFLRWSDWLYARLARTDQIALVRLAEALFTFLTQERRLDPSSTALALWNDYLRGGRSDKPAFLLPHLPADLAAPRRELTSEGIPRRQSRHLPPADRKAL